MRRPTQSEKLERAYERFEVEPESGLVVHRDTGRIKRPQIDKLGRHRIRFHIKTKQETVPRAALVMRQRGLFDPDCFQICRHDGDQSNDRIENLFLLPKPTTREEGLTQ